MSIKDIRLAFQGHLNTIVDPLPTKWDNKDITISVDEPYQIAYLKTGKPDDMCLGFDDPSLHSGFFQIDLLYPTDKSPTDAEQRADELALLFKKGTRLPKNDVIVRINNTPDVRIVGEENGRYKVIVTIFYIV